MTLLNLWDSCNFNIILFFTSRYESHPSVKSFVKSIRHSSGTCGRRRQRTPSPTCAMQFWRTHACNNTTIRSSLCFALIFLPKDLVTLPYSQQMIMPLLQLCIIVCRGDLLILWQRTLSLLSPSCIWLSLHAGQQQLPSFSPWQSICIRLHN